MTREEAICELSVIWERLRHPEDCENGCYSFRDGDYLEALDMAIEALQTIDNCDQCEWCCPSDGTPTIHVVRCKDCKYYDESLEVCRCSQWDLSRIEYPMVGADDFCSYGERKE